MAANGTMTYKQAQAKRDKVKQKADRLGAELKVARKELADLATQIKALKPAKGAAGGKAKAKKATRKKGDPGANGAPAAMPSGPAPGGGPTV